MGSHSPPREPRAGGGLGTTRQRGQTHQRVALSLAALAAGLIVVLAPWSDASRHLVVVPGVVLALVVLWRLGCRFDRADPWASTGVALLRLIAPALSIVVGSLFLMFGHSETDYGLSDWSVVILIVSIVPVVMVVGPLFDTRPSAATQRAWALGTPPAPGTGRRLPIVFRSITSLVLITWIPLGFALIFMMNYCPPQGGGPATLARSIILYLLYVTATATAGWIMDRIWGADASIWVCVSRCAGAAVGVIVIGALGFAVLGNIFPVAGDQVYCG